MLVLRRASVAWGRALQGRAPGLACARAAASAPGNVEERGTPTEGEGLLAYWKTLLDARGGGTGSPLSDDDVRQLLATALRLRQGRGQPSALPDQLLAVFRRYFEQLGRPERLALFRTLAATFGVQARELDAAAATWQQLREQQQHAGARSAPQTAADGPRPEQLFKAAAALSAAAAPLYSRLFAPLSQMPGGIKFLVDMRAELLQAILENPSGAAPLRALSETLRSSLAEWFGAGLLQLRRISWEHSSAALLEKIAKGEAVHQFGGWRDLKSRLSAEDRRVYAFFHNAMPDEPLVVLHTALTNRVARSMRQLLPHLESAAGGNHGRNHSHNHARHGTATQFERTWEDRPARALVPRQPHLSPPEEQQAPRGQPPSVAVFYSISSTQRGLAGVDLGNFLIKQVARQVQAEFPSVTTLVTLSPVPGFADWLRLQLGRVGQGLLPPMPLLLPDEAEQLEAVAAGHLSSGGWARRRTTERGDSSSDSSSSGSDSDSEAGSSSGGEGPEQAAMSAHAWQAEQERAAVVLGWALADDAWLHSNRLEAALEAPLMRLAAHYLLREQRRGLALDPVANFHLRNGAAVLQLNWHADASPAGLSRSHGIMVNYAYELDRLQENNRAYLVDGVVPAAAAVHALLTPHG